MGILENRPNSRRIKKTKVYFKLTLRSISIDFKGGGSSVIDVGLAACNLWNEIIK